MFYFWWGHRDCNSRLRRATEIITAKHTQNHDSMWNKSIQYIQKTENQKGRIPSHNLGYGLSAFFNVQQSFRPMAKPQQSYQGNKGDSKEIIRK